MLVNLLLMRDGYPPALYTHTDRRVYLQALETAQFGGEIDPFVRVTAEAAQFILHFAMPNRIEGFASRDSRSRKGYGE